MIARDKFRPGRLYMRAVSVLRRWLSLWASISRPLRYLLVSRDVPNALYIEPVNICNANCIFCAYQFDQRQKKIMEEDVFKTAVDQYCAMGGEHVGLTPFAGEIFVDRNILDRVRYLRLQGLKRIHTYTNATLLHKFDTNELLEAGFTDLYISLSPPDEEIFRQIFRSPAYRHVIANVRDLLIAFRDSKSRSLQNISLEFRSDRVLEDCKSLPDYKTHIEPYLSKGVSVTAMQTFDGWSGLISPTDLLPGMNIKDPEIPKLRPCARIFNVQVMVGGELRLCGCRYDNGADHDELEIGNLNDTTIAEAFNSRGAKEKILSFQRGELLEVCKKCSWYETL